MLLAQAAFGRDAPTCHPLGALGQGPLAGPFACRQRHKHEGPPSNCRRKQAACRREPRAAPAAAARMVSGNHPLGRRMGPLMEIPPSSSLRPPTDHPSSRRCPSPSSTAPTTGWTRPARGAPARAWRSGGRPPGRGTSRSSPSTCASHVTRTQTCCNHGFSSRVASLIIYISDV